MSKITDRIAENSLLNEEYRLESEKAANELDMAVLMTRLRESTGMSKSDFSKKIEKSRSTIDRIEKNEMQPTFNLMQEIAHSLGKRIEYTIVDIDGDSERGEKDLSESLMLKDLKNGNVLISSKHDRRTRRHIRRVWRKPRAEKKTEYSVHKKG